MAENVTSESIDLGTWPTLANPEKLAADRISFDSDGKKVCTSQEIIPYDPFIMGPVWAKYEALIGSDKVGFTDLKLAEIDIQQDKGNGELAIVTLTYRLPEASQSPPAGGNPATVPDDECFENATVRELPIQEHPRWETVKSSTPESQGLWTQPNGQGGTVGVSMRDLWDFEVGEFSEFELLATSGDAAEQLSGVTSYTEGSFSVTCSEYSATPPATVESAIGRLSVPPGYSDAGHWLIVSGSVGLAGQFYRRSLVYQKQAWKPYPGWLYRSV